MSKKRILFVDDEAGFLRIIKLSLQDYEVCIESDSVKAIETARQFKPDMIFLDVIMPKLDGGDVAAQMKQDPVLKGLPIVFLTAIAPPTNRPESGEIFLKKPVGAAQLKRCIMECLGS